MNEFWNTVIGGIEEKYIGEAASAYVKNAPEEKTLYKINRPQSTRKKNKSLRIFGGIAAALVITGAVAIAAMVIGNNKVSVLSPSSVPAYSEKIIPAEELYPFTKLNEGYPFNDSLYYENGNEGMNYIFRMDETGEIYEPYFRTESDKTSSIFDKISGIRNINELTKVDTPDWARTKTSEFYLLPDGRLVEIYPVDIDGYSITDTEDSSDHYEAIFYYTDANIEAISVFTDEELSNLVNYPNLRKLIISSEDSDSMISDKAPFASLSKLEVLDISEVKISAEIIKELPVLRRVAVDCHSQPDMEYLKTVPSLKELNIYPPRGDFDVTGISTLSELEAVTISVAVSAFEPVPENVEGFEELALLPELKRLSLFSIGNENIGILGSLKKVEELVLGECNVGTLTFVNDMISLKTLLVRQCNLSDFALTTDNYTVEELDLTFNEELYDFTQLKAFKNLKKLTIHSSMPVIYKDIAEAAIAEFKELYPDVETDIGINYQEGELLSEDVIRTLEYEEISEIPDISEIEALLSDFKDFSYGYVSCKTVKDCISSDYIITEEMIDNGMNAGNIYEGKWYRVASGDITSQHSLFVRLYEIFTSEGITCLGLDNLYRAKDGDIFLSENAGYDGGLLGVDEIWLNEIEKTEASTICLKLSAFGDKDTWELEEDYSDSFEVILKNTTEGLRIHSLSSRAVDYLTWFGADCGREVTWTAF